ncbi:unnamed protein product [Heligmosomoides polygyrus]|uniref:Conserved secreted protein n=1 Tax=Heligmosomoides polygyrus TaxID=6339 RepID=A0A183GI36_HELPZ|nr:unnamed protein product [Heligmosomoides polygyrus]
MHRFLFLAVLLKTYGVNGINGATARDETTLIPGKLDDIPNTSIDNSLKDFHGVRKKANWTVRIRPRAGTQLDYYLFPTAVGRFLAALLCVALRLSSSEQIVTVVLLLVVPLMVLLLLLVKSVGKAVRLKEVMEYSTSPVLEASGEYVSLIERDIRCASSEEDDDDHSFASREI